MRTNWDKKPVYFFIIMMISILSCIFFCKQVAISISVFASGGSHHCITNIRIIDHLLFPLAYCYQLCKKKSECKLFHGKRSVSNQRTFPWSVVVFLINSMFFPVVVITVITLLLHLLTRSVIALFHCMSVSPGRKERKWLQVKSRQKLLGGNRRK